jgi:tungstate transport system substrate-binding protein
MGETIMMATEERAYTLSDRGTYNAFANGKTDLVILFEGEKGLFNPYGVIAVNPKKFPHVRYDLAMKFVDFVTSRGSPCSSFITRNRKRRIRVLSVLMVPSAC